MRNRPTPENWTRHGPGHLFVQADAESRVILGRVPRTKARHADQGALKRHTARRPLRMVRTGTACQLRKSGIAASNSSPRPTIDARHRCPWRASAARLGFGRPHGWALAWSERPYPGPGSMLPWWSDPVLANWVSASAARLATPHAFCLPSTRSSSSAWPTTSAWMSSSGPPVRK